MPFFYRNSLPSRDKSQVFYVRTETTDKYKNNPMDLPVLRKASLVGVFFQPSLSSNS